MKIFSRIKDRCLCAFCGSERRFYAKKHLDLTNVILSLILSAMTGTAFWGYGDGRFLVLFGLGLGVGEAFIYLRWRSFIVCHQCGFDPVLYRKSPELAKTKVRSFYDRKIKDPKFLLGQSPLLEFYRRYQQIERQNEMVNAYKQGHPAPAASAPAKVPAPPVAAKAPARSPQKQA
jgi:hypothetical protein